jgi:serine phosphatase RsbU (regulator of sigma subunit)
VGEFEQTQIVTRADVLDLVAGDRVHCLELTIGKDIERRHVVTPLGLKIGRTAPADIIIADSEISRSHCVIVLRGDDLLVTDLNSTNGTFVDGIKVVGETALPVGSMLQVGKRTLKHEWRTREEIEQSDIAERDLQRAASYVLALLPPPQHDGLIRADWIYKPSAKLGGDTFGYAQLNEHQYICYLIDVAGHGAGAAMHAVAITNQLRQKALPNTDMSRPELVLSTLNELFQMDDHDGLYFTAWYGVYDTRSRRLDYASGGHHATYLVAADREVALPLRTRNVVIGAMPAMPFTQASVFVPEGAACYLFSDGVFEVIDREGREWVVEDFVAHILAPPVPGLSEPQRLFNAVCMETGHNTFDDDFSLVVINFD